MTLVKYFNRAIADQSLGLIGWLPFSQTGISPGSIIYYYNKSSNNVSNYYDEKKKFVKFVIGVYLDSGS